jgi:hypothetical protein
VTALAAAVPGLVDYLGVRFSRPARRLATIHLGLNIGALALYALSLWLRWNGGALGTGRWPLAMGGRHGRRPVAGWAPRPAHLR